MCLHTPRRFCLDSASPAVQTDRGPFAPKDTFAESYSTPRVIVGVPCHQTAADAPLDTQAPRPDRLTACDSGPQSVQSARCRTGRYYIRALPTSLDPSPLA